MRPSRNVKDKAHAWEAWTGREGSGSLE